MEIGSLTSNYDLSAQESNKANKLRDSLNTTDYANAGDEQMMAACKEFEAYFVEMVFKEMEKTVDAFSDKEEGSNSRMVDFFKENTLQKLAGEMTETQGLGLAQQLFEQMKRNYSR